MFFAEKNQCKDKYTFHCYGVELLQYKLNVYFNDSLCVKGFEAVYVWDLVKLFWSDV